MDAQALELDAARFARACARDARSLHCRNHDQKCSFPCVKYAAASARQLAEGSLKTGSNIVCRFFFYVVLVFKVIQEGVERVIRVRRRGKARVPEAFVATAKVFNDLGRAQVVRHAPFRSPTSDVGQAAARCNFDFPFRRA